MSLHRSDFIVILLAFGIVGIVVYFLYYYGPMYVYSPRDALLAMSELSGSLAAGTITFVSISTSILISNVNDKISKQRNALRKQEREINRRLNEWNDIKGNKILKGIFDRSIENLRLYIEETKLMKLSDSSYGIASFLLFLLVAILCLVRLTNGWIRFIIKPFPFDFTILFFTLGLSLLLAYVLIFIRDLIRIDSLTKIRVKEGELNIIEINGKKPNKVNKSYIVNATGKEEITVKIAFKGRLRNGFIDAEYLLSSGTGIWVPDKLTFLSEVGYIYETKLYYLQPELQTGALHGNFIFEDTLFELKYRIRRKKAYATTSIYDPQLHHAILFSEDYLMQTNDKVDKIIIRMYEDPFGIPDVERRDVDSKTLVLKYD